MKLALGQQGNVNNGNKHGKVIQTLEQRAAKTIRGCLILHNMLINLKDSVVIDHTIEEAETTTQASVDTSNDAVAGEEAKQTQDMVKKYLALLDHSKRQRL